MLERDLAGANLVEHRLDQARLHLDRRLAGVELVETTDRPGDGLAGGDAVEVVEAEVVSVRVGDVTAEQVADAGVGVLAHGDQEVGPQAPGG